MLAIVNSSVGLQRPLYNKTKEDNISSLTIDNNKQVEPPTQNLIYLHVATAQPLRECSVATRIHMLNVIFFKLKNLLCEQVLRLNTRYRLVKCYVDSVFCMYWKI